MKEIKDKGKADPRNTLHPKDMGFGYTELGALIDYLNVKIESSEGNLYSYICKPRD